MLDKKIVTHIFASLQTLEKSSAEVHRLLSRNPDEEFSEQLKDQDKIVREMRRIANRLQFEVAKNDVLSATRSLRLFYGMNHMIRKDILSAQRTLTEYIESGKQKIGQLQVSETAEIAADTSALLH